MRKVDLAFKDGTNMYFEIKSKNINYLEFKEICLSMMNNLSTNTKEILFEEFFPEEHADLFEEGLLESNWLIKYAQRVLNEV